MKITTLVTQKEAQLPKHLEIERRFIPRNPPTPRGAVTRDIVQGYFQTPAYATVRIRQTGGPLGTYELTRKTGRGRTRSEEPHAIRSHALGQALLAACPYVLKKKRYLLPGGWELDRYAGPLKGLWVLERELKSASAPCVLPTWVDSEQTPEVTGYLTNYDLAKFASALSGLKNPPSIFDLITQPLPTIVITGGPCSGKSSILRMLKSTHAQQVHVVPETASIIINDVGIAYPAENGLFVRQFQQQIYTVQQSFEFLAGMRGKLAGQRAVVVDRGSLDSIAYLPQGRHEFERTCQTRLAHEYDRYAAVIYLSVPPRAVYEQHKANNPARRESYEEAVSTGHRTAAAWKGHRNFYYVANEDWDAKVQTTLSIVASLIS